MDNTFLTQHFDWNRPSGWRVRFANHILRGLGSPARAVGSCQTGAMTTVEERINLFHLVEQVLAYRVRGELVEMGTLYGSAAAVMQGVEPGRRLHVYDSFSADGGASVCSNFAELSLRPPTVHAGDLHRTLPGELPTEIAFAHLDLGPGDRPAAVAQALRHALESVYPRLAAGGVCLLADYCRAEAYERPGWRWPATVPRTRMWNIYPHVREVADGFLADKPERLGHLYGGEFSHGYFRKV